MISFPLSQSSHAVFAIKALLSAAERQQKALRYFLHPLNRNNLNFLPPTSAPESPPGRDARKARLVFPTLSSQVFNAIPVTFAPFDSLFFS